ncbi:MAG: P-II family nitrogen regulator [Planctomycetota bacterium]|jgi:nitrogen regulatory protein PII
MKKIEAYIKPHRLSEVTMALHHIPHLSGMTVCDVRGWGRGKQQMEKRDHAEQVSDFEQHTKIEVLCAEERVGQIVDAILHAARTGLAGDGKILVSQVEHAVRISTGEPCDEADDREKE